jgi:prophage antirepressor-like protein
MDDNQNTKINGSCKEYLQEDDKSEFSIDCDSMSIFSRILGMSKFNADNDFKPLTVIRNNDTGIIYFYAKEVADAIGLTNSTSMLRSSCILDEDKSTFAKMTARGPQQSIIITEWAMYDCLTNSRKPLAQRFKRWITRDVIPAIRRDGQYDMLNVKPQTELGKSIVRAFSGKETLAVTRENRVTDKKANQDRNKKNSDFNQNELRDTKPLNEKRANEIMSNYRTDS